MLGYEGQSIQSHVCAELSHRSLPQTNPPRKVRYLHFQLYYVPTLAPAPLLSTHGRPVNRRRQLWVPECYNSDLHSVVLFLNDCPCKSCGMLLKLFFNDSPMFLIFSMIPPMSLTKLFPGDECTGFESRLPSVECNVARLHKVPRIFNTIRNRF